MAEKKLLEQLHDVIRMKHYSIKTEKAYVYWIRRFILFHNKRHPKEMGENEISAFLSFLAVRENVAASTQNQALNAIVFLYKQVLKVEVKNIESIVWAKKPARLPVVLTKDEVKKILAHLTGRDHLAVSLLYGAGLRLRDGT